MKQGIKWFAVMAIFLTAGCAGTFNGTLMDDRIKAFVPELTPELTPEQRLVSQRGFCRDRYIKGFFVKTAGTVSDLLVPVFISKAGAAVIRGGSEAALENMTTQQINQLCEAVK